MLSTTKYLKNKTGQSDGRNSIKKETKSPSYPSLEKINIDDDNNVDYDTFSEYLGKDTDRNKNKIASEIQDMGEKLIQEIEDKKYLETIKKHEYIPYILKHSKGIISAEELLSYSLNDVKRIYLDVKEEKKSRFVRFFRFIFNI
jgi:hypothetical protein